MSEIITRPACPTDAAAVADIYNYYVAQTTATFQKVLTTADDVQNQMAESAPFLCAVQAGVVRGYCYARAFKPRCGYRHTLEISVYMDATITRQRIGSVLMRALIHHLKQTDCRMVVAVIGLPNPASIALHEKFGFVHCGTLPSVGRKFDKWIDSGYWILDLHQTLGGD